MKLYRCYLFCILVLFSCSTKLNHPQTATIDSSIELLPSINQQLENKQHPITDIWYRRVVTQRAPNGSDVAIIVPQFDTIFEYTLPDNLLLASDAKQKRYLNQKLKSAINEKKSLKKKFTKKQLEMIEANKTPIGYVWHHDAPLGNMQLVGKIIHDATQHTGGRWIWGGGTNNRK